MARLNVCLWFNNRIYPLFIDGYRSHSLSLFWYHNLLLQKTKCPQSSWTTCLRKKKTQLILSTLSILFLVYFIPAFFSWLLFTHIRNQSFKITTFAHMPSLKGLIHLYQKHPERPPKSSWPCPFLQCYTPRLLAGASKFTSHVQA